MYALVMYFNVDHLFYYYLFIPLICILLYIYIYIFFFPYGPLSEIKDYYYYYYYNKLHPLINITSAIIPCVWYNWDNDIRTA